MNQPQFKKYLKDVMDEKGLTIEEGNDEKKQSEKITPISTRINKVKEAEAKTSIIKKDKKDKKDKKETKKLAKAIDETPKPKEISPDTMLIVETLNRLIDKIDVLINTTPPEIVVPTPIIKLSVPEGNKTIVKRIERDERGLIKRIIEEPESLLEQSVVTFVEKETVKEDSIKKTKRKNK